MSPTAALLRRRLAAARRRITGAAIARGLLVTAAIVGAGLLASIGLEAGVWLGVELRTALFWVLVGTFVTLIVALVGVPLLRSVGVLPGLDEDSVVRRTGQDFEGVDDRLATLLDLADRHASGDGDRLHAAAIDALGAQVEAVPFERVRVFGPVRQALPWALVPAAILILALVLAPNTVGAAAARLLSPGEYFAPPAPFTLSVDPGDTEATRGATLEVTVRAAGRQVPVSAVLEVGRADEDATETVNLTSTDATASASTFVHALEVGADLRYRVMADGVRSPWYTIEAVDRPLVRGVRVTVVPPGYSGRAPRAQPEGVGDATGLVGSAVRVQVGHGGPTPTEAWIEVEWESGQTQRVPLRIGSEAALGQFRLRGPGRYSVHLKAASGLENTDPARYALGVLSDAPPQITIVGGLEDALSTSSRSIAFRVTDDFGFRGGALVYRLTRDGSTSRPRSVRLPMRSRPLDQEVALDWRLPGARPGDTVELYGRVTDNDGAGGKTARTPLVTLRYPSVADRLDALDAQRDSTTETLENIEEQAQESQERFRRLRDDIRQNQNPDWEDRRQVEELLREQQSMQEQSQQLKEQMQRLGEQIRDDLGSPELQRQFDEMQQVLDELNTPELRDALERLRDAMEQLDLRDMLEQSEEAAQSEEELQRRIERAMELMKRLEAAVEMEEIARRAEDLAETEEKLARQTEAIREGRDPDDLEDESDVGEESNAEESEGSETGTPEQREKLAEEQRQAQEQAEALQEQMDALQEQMEEIRNAPTEEMQEMQEESEGLPQQMEENAEQLEQGELEDAQQGQQDMSEQLRQMAQQMRTQSQQMQGQQKQVDQAALRRALEDVLTISRDQEALAARVASVPSQSPALVPAARRQAELRDALATVVDTLRRVAQTVPSLGPRIDERAEDGRREMDLALERLVDRQAGPAAANQRTSMAHLNSLALLLADLLDQLQNQQNQNGSGGGGGSSKGSGGMGEQMQQAGQRQAEINRRIQEMLNRGAGGERLSPGEGRELRQMAEQQEALRRQIQRALEGGGAGMNPNDRGALQRIEEQMKEQAAELRNGRLNQRTAPRQQQILEQLLEAERSANQRGREERREAETGRAQQPPPASMPRTTRPPDRVRADLIRALESGYSPDYQDMIKRYFERLQQRVSG